MADVLLKVRAINSDLDVDEALAEARQDIAAQDGHAYDTNIMHAVTLDLARLAGFGRCA